MPRIKLRLPNIKGNSDKEQIEQMKNYLHYLVGELQWAFDLAEDKKENEKTGGKK